MNPQQIKLSCETINNIDLTPLVQYIEWNDQNKQYFNLDSGQEHYKILAFFAQTLNTNKPLIDIGTYFGFSATALAAKPSNRVISYDIYDWIPDDYMTVKNKDNIELRCADCLDEIDILIDSDFICLDVSPHDGIQEEAIYQVLKKYKFKGLLFLDDIHLNKEMHDWWESIDLKKYDLSKYGHFSGSGIVVFDPERFNIILD